ncbi:S41 family peptidase [Bacteroidota bacterium]
MINNQSKTIIYLPIALSIVLALGIYLGSGLQVGYLNQGVVSTSANDSKKITNLLNYIEEQYVDSVNLEGLTESAIIQLLNQLDPHSAYIPASELEATNESLNGNFDGIGVEFNVLNDTIVVVAPISGGPSDKLGIHSGDRIVTIEDSLVAGNGIQSKDVIKLLRGERGTAVSIEVFRKGEKGLIRFDIIRDKIPIYSVDAGYMINDKVGYIKISRFAATTFDEFAETLSTLKKEGLQKLILDLRGNPGGYLTAAINICDEFLPNGQLIVYTEGRARTKNSSYATSQGNFEKGEIVVLIDEGSASASEIVAGAVQDNDRGIVIGRRSFGKGLVQEQADLPDGSAVRLTIARYYTPTGRCIQRPYGDVDDYYADLYNRYENGELYEKDSIEVNEAERFVTPKGKVVYGGGGIMPDVFVSLDTTRYSAFHRRLVNAGVVREFALELAAKYQSAIAAYGSIEVYRAKFKPSEDDWRNLLALAKAKGVNGSTSVSAETKAAVLNNLKALVARSQWNGQGYYPIINERDNVVEAALKQLN